MRRPLIAGNWKMHKTIAEAVSFVQGLLPHLNETSSHVWIAPPFTALHACAQTARTSALKLGGQNLHESEFGAFTGEISAPMLVEAGASFTLIGHSERRQFFHEKGPLIQQKVERALLSKLVPLLCIGETAEERQKGRTHQVLKHQIEEALREIQVERLRSLVIAYEPVWAIGTGQTATPELAQQAHFEIRQTIAQRFGDVFAKQLTLLYGGSVKPSNIAELMRQPDIDGVLVGGASLELESFLQLIELGKKP